MHVDARTNIHCWFCFVCFFRWFQRFEPTPSWTCQWLFRHFNTHWTKSELKQKTEREFCRIWDRLMGCAPHCTCTKKGCRCRCLQKGSHYILCITKAPWISECRGAGLMDAPQRWLSEGSLLFSSVHNPPPPSPTLPEWTNSQTTRNNVINCFLVVGPAEFLCSKEVQIRHAFTSSQTLTNVKKEHINDAQLRSVISLALLAACYQLESGR